MRARTRADAYTCDSLLISRLHRGSAVRVFYDPAQPDQSTGLFEQAGWRC